MKHSEDFLSVVKAINKARPNFSQPNKDKTVKAGSGSWQYSTLESILTACQKPLSDQGVEMFGGVVKNDHGDWVFEIKFIHIDGAWMSFTHPVFEDGNQRDRNKAVGSGRTYAWRYVLSSALGLGADPDIDDDGDLAYPEQNKGKTITNSPRTSKPKSGTGRQLHPRNNQQREPYPQEYPAVDTLPKLAQIFGWTSMPAVSGYLATVAQGVEAADFTPEQVIQRVKSAFLEAYNDAGGSAHDEWSNDQIEALKNIGNVTECDDIVALCRGVDVLR